MRFTASLILIGALAIGVVAQRPRTVSTSDNTSATTVAPAPKTVKAKYEGGVFGYNKTMNGTLTFDDENNRLLFRNKEQKDVLFIPYEAITSAYGDTHKKQPAAATIAGHIPSIYALPAGFIKTTVRYLTIQYNDQDSRVNGTTSFKLENKQILESVLKTLADKSGMTLRGQVYVKKRDSGSDDTQP